MMIHVRYMNNQIGNWCVVLSLSFVVISLTQYLSFWPNWVMCGPLRYGDFIKAITLKNKIEAFPK